MTLQEYDQAAPAKDTTPAIEAVELTKVYSQDIRAVDGISFSVAAGEVFGLLGPNGAGKTTTMKMFIGLTKPTSGTLRVFGKDVRKSQEQVRGMLGFVPQNVSVDGDLTGFENLLIFSKLFYVGREARTERIKGALEYMGLADRADDLVKHYSGGMMRRLEIAQALVNRPRILFLDEPSIGLDPLSKRQLWQSIRQLNVEFGATVVITTHDMEEADTLCSKVAIIDSGKLVAMGSPTKLKESVGGELVTVELAEDSEIALPPQLGTVIHREGRRIELSSLNGSQAVPRIVEFFDRNNVHTNSVSINRPTLDDVFLKYTKKRLESGSFREAKAARRSFARHAR